MARIGFFGGTFNPPTTAHIELAKKIIQECKIDRVVFVPVNDLYKKDKMVKSEHRINMLKIACKDNTGLEVSDIETRNQIEYNAIDIFRIIRKQYKNDEIFFIMGTDNLTKLPNWKEKEELIKEFKYIILDRGHIQASDIIQNNMLLLQNKNNFKVIKNKRYRNYSSTYIRNQIKYDKIPKNLNIDVYNYIKINNLYT